MKRSLLLFCWSLAWCSSPSRNLLLFPSSDCVSQAQLLTIGAELHSRGHSVSALVEEACSEEAVKFLHSLQSESASAATNSAASSSRSSGEGDGGVKNSSFAQDQAASEACGATAEGGGVDGEGDNEGSCTMSADHEQQEHSQPQTGEKQEGDQTEEPGQQPGAQTLQLLTYQNKVNLEEFVSTKAAMRDVNARVSLGHRTDFALSSCGALLANTSLMASLKAAGYDAVVGDLSDACSWPLADALGVEARIDVDVTGSSAPPYLAYGIRYPLAYVPAEGSGLAGGTLSLSEKAKNLYHHAKLWWEKRWVLRPKVEAFRRQYAELHPGLLRGQQAQRAQQALQAQQPSMSPGSSLPHSQIQQRQQQRQVLENELNAVKDARLATLLCIVTSDWAFQEPYALAPLIKHVGPVLPGPPKPLPPQLQAFIEAKGRRGSIGVDEHGEPLAPPTVIVGSLGRGHSRLSKQALVGLAEAFSELTSLRIVWHLTPSQQEKLSQWYKPVTVARHVLTTSVFPLNDLLAHPNVRAYMCDGSLPSMYHALWHGVPMLTVAMNVEQESNVARALRLGVARRLQRSHLEQGFGFMVEHALSRVASGAAYRVRVAELSRRMQAANPEPARSAADAIEGALNAGTSTFLHSMEVFLPYWKVMMLDVVAAFLGIVLGSITVTWALVFVCGKTLGHIQGKRQEGLVNDFHETMKKFR